MESWLRLAVHTGEAAPIGAESGPAYEPLAAQAHRLVGAAHGGQVLLSATARALVRQTLPDGVRLRPLGAYRLPGAEQPEQVYQVLHPALPATFPPLRAPPAHPTNLPAPLTSFLGREHEQAAVLHALASSRLVTLCGAGGCGKTRLALQVAGSLLTSYRDGVWLVELAALADAGLVVRAVAAVLGVRDEPGRSLLTTLTTHLAGRDLLLVLDNCEHLVGACAELAAHLLQNCPRLRLLATSREPLAIDGETIWRVPSLSLPEATNGHLPRTGKKAALAELRGSDAVQLFVARAQASRPAFRLDAATAPLVIQVCRRLDGLPLALELAAARLAALSVEQLAGRLDDRFRLLTGGSRTALPRQQTLRATMDWSYELLSEAERVLLRRLSVFAGGWTLEAAEAVCADPAPSAPLEQRGGGIQAAAVLDLLSRLVAKSLVQVELEGGQARYGMLETVRQYAMERLAANGEDRAVYGAHGAWYLALAEQAAPKLVGPEQARWLDCLAQEHENLRAALRWHLHETHEAGTGLRLAYALRHFWLTRGYLSEGRQSMEAALATEGDAPPVARAWVQKGAGEAAYHLGDLEAAVVHFEQSLASFQRLGVEEGIADTLADLGEVAVCRGDHGQAQRLYEQSLALHRRLGCGRGAARVLNNLGYLAYRKGDYRRSLALGEEGLALYRRVGDESGLALLTNNVGFMALRLGEVERARILLEEGLALFRKLGEPRGIAGALTSNGLVAEQAGDWELATRYYEESLELSRQIGELRGVANAHASVRRLAYYQADYDRTAAHAEAGLALWRELNDPRGIAGELLFLGHIARQRADPARAVALLRESLSLYQSLGDQVGCAAACEGLAQLAAALSKGARAARLWGAAAAVREHSSAPQLPPERAQQGAAMASVRGILGEDSFAAAWAAGYAMSLDQAIAFAQEA